jgi:hypothetical protein
MMTSHSTARVLAVLCVGTLLRLPWLGAWPSPAGDEANWALLGLQLHQGIDAGLPSDAAFVTTAFGWLIAGAFKVFGPSWKAARLVPVVGLLVGAGAAARYCNRLGEPRAGGFIALALMLHPWAVLWSRTVSVPYALSLALSVVGPLAFLDAQRTRDPWQMLLAAQLLGFGFHFSPLAAIPLGACVLHSFGTERPRGRTLAAASTALVHILPVACGSLMAMQRGSSLGAPGEPLPVRLLATIRMMLAQIAGTSTAAHAVGLSPSVMVVGAAGACAFLARVVGQAEHPLTRFARIHFVVALVGLPTLLWPGRAWHMPTIDADRYGFVLVAPLGIALGGLASERSKHARNIAAATLVGLSLLTLTTLAGARGTEGDRGLFTARGGGGYRGWQVPREGIALVDLLCDTVIADAHGAPAVLTYDDYAFHAVRFSLAARAIHTLQHAFGRDDLPPGVRVYRALWAPEAFAPGYEPIEIPRRNEQRRREAGVLLRRFVTPHGRPLCELWRIRP